MKLLLGGRRLAALLFLLNAGDISADYLVDCLIKAKEDAIALSLSENIKAPMHPADQFMAYQKMIDQGKSIKEIAGEFGVTQPHVKRRLKLASVSPTLINYFKQGKVTLEHIMAFTVSDDHDHQLACYKDLCPHLSEHRIKQFLLGQALRSDDPMVKFVTLQTYKKAGGSTISDLFNSVTYIHDREVLEQLAQEKLEKEMQTILKEGWKWGEVTFDQHHGSFRYLSADLKGVPKKILDAVSEKQNELDELNEKDYEDWSSSDEQKEEDLNTEIEVLENRREKYRAFTDEQKSVSGILVSFSYNGEIMIERGLVKKEDYKDAFPSTNTDSDTTGDNHHNPNTADTGIESNALVEDLKNFKLQALQSVLIDDDDLCHDLMLFTLARNALGEWGYWAGVLDVDISFYDNTGTADIDNTSPAKTIEEKQAKLNISWLSFDDEGDQFTAFRELTRSEKKKIMSYCVAYSYKSRGNSSLGSAISQILSFQIEEHWKPTKDNYFSRIKKDDLLDIGKSHIGGQWYDDHKKLTKGPLVDHIEGNEAMIKWMPESILG